MRRVAVLVLVLAGAVPARAQDRLFVGAREVGAIGHFGMDLGTAPVLLHFPRFGGDRFVHDRAGHAIVDLRTGARLQVPNGVPVAYDRARPRLFTAENDGIWSHDVVTGWSALLLAVPVQQFVGCLHATSADVLFCAFTRVDGQVDILRPSLAGPMWVTTTRFADLSFPSWVATPDGSRVYFEHCSRLSDQFPNFCVQRNLAVLDTASGRITVGSSPEPFTSYGRLVWDEMRERLFTIGSPRIDVYSRDLDVIASAATGGRCRDLAISPHTGRVYVNVHDYYYGVTWATLSAYDGESYRLLEPGQESTTAVCGPVMVLTAPGVPRDLDAVVSGHSVALSWTNLGAASHFVLDVGFARGRTAFSLFAGTEPRSFFEGVPPGTYYVRVRGGNIHGGGRPSNEIVVHVP